MSTSTLPAPKDVRDMLEGLLFRDVTVAPGTPVDPTKPVGVGVFVDDSHTMAVVAVTDLALAAYAGAAIGLVPVGGADMGCRSARRNAMVPRTHAGGHVHGRATAMERLPLAEHPSKTREPVMESGLRTRSVTDQVRLAKSSYFATHKTSREVRLITSGKN